MDQPVPQVSRADVERIVRRDYPADAGAVLRLLDEYGNGGHHREVTRVQLAILKLAHGNGKKLRVHLEDAKLDYRDSLAPAEYPSYERKIGGPGAVPEDEQRRIIEADWNQYQAWLRR